MPLPNDADDDDPVVFVDVEGVRRNVQELGMLQRKMRQTDKYKTINTDFSCTRLKKKKGKPKTCKKNFK